jgi:hypothetical protein
MIKHSKNKYAYLKDVVADFFENLKEEPVLINALDKILTGYYNVPKEITKKELIPMILKDNRIVKKIIAIEGKKKKDYLIAKEWIFHIDADENTMLDRITDLYEEYRLNSSKKRLWK